MCLSTERDGRETFPATVRHDGVEDAARARLELTAGIGLIQPTIPRPYQETSNRTPELPGFFHACQCDGTPSRKLQAVAQKTANVVDQLAQEPSRWVQFLLRRCRSS